MNDVYFRCETCRSYINAGYRWCYWELEKPGIVARELPISIQAVLAATEYWKGPAEEPSLAGRLPAARRFLEAHAEHRIIYGEFETLLRNDEFLKWRCEDDDDSDVLPRALVERLKLEHWTDVISCLKTLTTPPWCWLASSFRISSHQSERDVLDDLSRRPFSLKLSLFSRLPYLPIFM